MVLLFCVVLLVRSFCAGYVCVLYVLVSLFVVRVVFCLLDCALLLLFVVFV